MKLLYIIIVASALLTPYNSLQTQMTGGDYEIYGDVFSFVDTNYSTGGDYKLYDSGETIATSTGSGSYELRGGFQALEKGILSLTLSDSNLNLGTLSQVQVSTTSLDITISTDSETGYSVSISEDGNLRKGAGGDPDDVDDVSDGTVSAGSEEYGISTSGSDGLLVSDTAIDGSVDVAFHSGQVTNHSTEVVFKASIDSGSIGGNYSHTVTFTTTVNP